MTASDDLWDSEPQPTPDAVLDWIADRINARPWPIEGGYPVRMQGIDDGTADLDLLPAGFDPEEDWEDPPAPVVRYRITVTPEPQTDGEPRSIRRSAASAWYRFGWPRAWAEFSYRARGLPQGSAVRRWVARREGWGYDVHEFQEEADRDR